jgi:hypothetical protein
MNAHRLLRGVRMGAALLALGLAAGCGGGDGNGGDAVPTATTVPTMTAAPTRTAAPTGTATVAPTSTPTTALVPTATPTQQGAANVSGLVVVNGEVLARSGDALMPLPPESTGVADPSFDRALSYADWTIVGEDVQGQIGADGRFEISGLTAGHYVMNVVKTLDGNLMSAAVPFAVGDDGSAEVLAEVGWGRVRSVATYESGGAQVRETWGPNGTHAVVVDGRLTQIDDPGRTYRDEDGDGRFERDGCNAQPSLCSDEAVCADGTVCSCVASCPFCDDCRAGVCGLPGPFPLYTCSDDGSCAQPGDHCVCVPSCPDCADCSIGVCLPSCEPADITAVDVSVAPQIVVDRQAQATALARLSDGTIFDVTWLVDWSSSVASVATVDAWGTVSALSIGKTEITATLGDVTSPAVEVEVVEQPAVRSLEIRNVNCYYPLGWERPGDPTEVGSLPPEPDIGFLAPPLCNQVVRIGATIQFAAVAQFADDSYEDVTDRAEWNVAPLGVADVVGGLFLGRAAGTAQVSATFDEVASNTVEVRVVEQPAIVSLSIYADDLAFPVFDGGPVRPEADAPCFECGYFLTLLRGDDLQFRATAHYETGEWADVTDLVVWSSSDPAVAAIDASGHLDALAAGEASISASLDEVTSAPLDLRVVDQATLLSLYVYEETPSRAIGVGEEAVFHAVANYDVGFSRDVTDQVTWRSSDESVGGFDEPGIFVGRAAGNVQVWAVLDGTETDRLPMEVYETADIEYCDPNAVNRATWSDDFNRVVLESDCAQYTPPGLVTLRYTVTEQQQHGGVFDPCLDLYVLQEGRMIRTLREEGCGDPFLAAGAPERDEAQLKYQLLAFWDLKDEDGQTVPPGTYTIFGRFYLYYDPVVQLDVTVR